MHFDFAYFYFVLIHLELKRQIRSDIPVVPSKTIPDSRPKWTKCMPAYPFSDQKGPKTIPFGAEHIYMAYIREYPRESML